MKHPKVLCTPHLGASTVEAQDRVAVETVEMLVEALEGLAVRRGGEPAVPGRGRPARGPAVDAARRDGRGVRRAGAPRAPPTQIAVTLAGGSRGDPEGLRRRGGEGGPLAVCAEGVNLVNAPTLARLNGISVTDSVRDDTGGYANLVTVTSPRRRAERGRDALRRPPRPDRGRRRPPDGVHARGNAPRDHEPGRAGRRRADRNAPRGAGGQHRRISPWPAGGMAGRPPSCGSTGRTARHRAGSRRGRSRRSRGSSRRGS